MTELSKLSDNPLVSVVIPTKNRAKEIPLMLDSLVKQNYRNFEVVIVDGGSSDNIAEVVASYKARLNIRMVVKTGGLVPQMNQGIREAKGELFIRTDDDAEYTPETIEALVSTFKMGEDIGGVTGPTVTPDKQTRDLFLFQERFKSEGTLWRLIGRFYFNYLLEGRYEEFGKFAKSGVPTMGSNLPAALALSHPVEVDGLECITYCVRTELLRSIGGFDEIYATVGDWHESDACLRMREAGYRLLLNPKAYAFHHTSKSGVFSARSGSFWRTVNFINFYFRHFHPNTFDLVFRFLGNLLFQNAYYTYMFFHQHNLQLLGCWPASVYAIFVNLTGPPKVRRGV